MPYIAHSFYRASLLFNAVRVKEIIQSIGRHGHGLKPPTCHELQLPLPKKEREIPMLV